MVVGEFNKTSRSGGGREGEGAGSLSASGEELFEVVAVLREDCPVQLGMNLEKNANQK